MKSIALAAAIAGLAATAPVTPTPSPGAMKAMAISVSDGVDAAAPGDELTYTISLRNNGVEASGELGVSFRPPTGAELLTMDHDGVPQNGAAKWTVDVPARESLTLTARVRVSTTPAEINGLAGIACVLRGETPTLCATDMNQVPGRRAISAVAEPDSSPGWKLWAWVAAGASVVLASGFFLVTRRALARRRATE